MPCRVTPRAMTRLSSANVLPSRKRTTTSSWSSRRSLNSCSARALARMKRRETLEALSPNASGTASAQASERRQLRPCRTRRNKPVSAGSRLARARRGSQGHFLLPDPIAHLRVGDGQFLIQQIHRAGLRTPADDAGLPPRAAVTCPRQGGHFLQQGLMDRLQAQLDQRLDQPRAELSWSSTAGSAVSARRRTVRTWPCL